MSIEKSIYLGPYVVVPREEVEKAVYVEGCPKCKTEYGKEGFCDKCGTKKAPYQKIVKADKVDTWALQEKMKERLYCPHPMCGHLSETQQFWLPNHEVPAINRQCHYYGNTEDDQGVTELYGTPIGNEVSVVEVAAFRDFFKKELAMIEEAYGKSEVKWGFIIYYS